MNAILHVFATISDALINITATCTQWSVYILKVEVEMLGKSLSNLAVAAAAHPFCPCGVRTLREKIWPGQRDKEEMEKKE